MNKNHSRKLGRIVTTVAAQIEHAQSKFGRTFLSAITLLPAQSRGATATKAFKARALPKFWVAVNPISTRRADNAHHSSIGLVWLKFAVAPLGHF